MPVAEGEPHGGRDRPMEPSQHIGSRTQRTPSRCRRLELER